MASVMLKQFGELDFIFGVTSDEGGRFIGFLDYTLGPQGAAIDSTRGYTPDAFNNVVIPKFISYIPHLHLTVPLQSVINHIYVNWKATTDKKVMRQITINFMSDVDFNAGMIYASNIHSGNGGPGHTYFYVYDHQLSYQPSDRGYNGAAHAEELPVVFGFDKAMAPPGTSDDPASILSDHEILLSRQIMEYWTNFANTG